MDPFKLIEKNDIDKLIDYLYSNDLNIKNEVSDNLLLFAIKCNKVAVASSLIKEFININEKDGDGNTALNLSVIYNKVGLVRQILQIDSVNINESNNINNTPIMNAFKYNRTEIIDLLLSKKPILSDKNIFGEDIYFLAVRGKNIDNLLKLPKILNLYVKNNKKETLLHISTLGGDCATSTYLLKLGIYVDVFNNDGETPLFYALRQNDMNLVTLLLQNGALIEYENKFSEKLLNLNSSLLSYIGEYQTSPKYINYIKDYKSHYLVRIRKVNKFNTDNNTSKYHKNVVDPYNRSILDYIKLNCL